MASKLEKAREIINEVDTQMTELFVKRMRAAELVYEYKKGILPSHSGSETGRSGNRLQFRKN